jgi:hypothetical protein
MNETGIPPFYFGCKGKKFIVKNEEEIKTGVSC